MRVSELVDIYIKKNFHDRLTVLTSSITRQDCIEYSIRFKVCIISIDSLIYSRHVEDFFYLLKNDHCYFSS